MDKILILIFTLILSSCNTTATVENKQGLEIVTQDRVVTQNPLGENLYHYKLEFYSYEMLSSATYQVVYSSTFFIKNSEDHVEIWKSSVTEVKPDTRGIYSIEESVEDRSWQSHLWSTVITVTIVDIHGKISTIVMSEGG